MGRIRVTLYFLIFTLGPWSPGHAGEAIRVGVLYSQTGTMAISETSLKDALLMQIDQQNRRGGLLGRQLEPVSSILLPNGPCTVKKRDSFCSGKRWR